MPALVTNPTRDPAARARSIIADQVADKIMSRICKSEQHSALGIMRDEIEALLIRLNYTGEPP